jgi:translation initiation factor IF-3
LIATDGRQLGILPLGDAITMARSAGVDLVEIAPNATPPVCRLVDFGKYRYELAKRDKEAKKHQHANRVKEIQLTATIDPHDFGVKVNHAIGFLCEEMKVKASLRFRGREMAHQEFGFKVVQNFIKELAPYGHPDAQPRLVGRGLNVMLSPLPRNKRAPNPNKTEDNLPDEDADSMNEESSPNADPSAESTTPSSASNGAPAPVENLDSKTG